MGSEKDEMSIVIDVPLGGAWWEEGKNSEETALDKKCGIIHGRAEMRA